MRIWDDQGAAKVAAPVAIRIETRAAVTHAPRTRARRSAWLSPTAVGTLAAAVAGVILGLRPLQDNSFLTHLATGRLILDHMAVPSFDPYSFTGAGTDWVVQSWLPSVLYASVERLGGDLGLLALRALTTASLTLLAWRLTRPATSFAGRLVPLVLLVGSSATQWPQRPLLIGLVLFAAGIVVIEEDRWPIWTLVPLGWVWVNSHGTFPLLLAYLCVRIVGRKLDGTPVDRHLRLLGAAAAGIAVGAVGPLGLSALTFPFHMLGRDKALEGVVEWGSPTFTDPANMALLVFAMCALVLPRQRRWEDLLPSAAFLVLAATGLRHVPWAAVVFVPVVARAIPLRTQRTERRPLDGVVVALLIATCVVVGVGKARQGAYDLRRYPVAELAWMADNGLNPKTTRVAHPDFVGNYLEWRDGDDANVFFDDRFDMYPIEVVQSHLTLFRGVAGWDEALDQHGIHTVLWPKKLPLGQLLAADARWDIVHESNSWVVAVRR